MLMFPFLLLLLHAANSGKGNCIANVDQRIPYWHCAGPARTALQHVLNVPNPLEPLERTRHAIGM